MVPVRSVVVTLCAVAAGIASRADATASHRLPGAHVQVAARDTGARALDSTLALATFDSAWRTVHASLNGRGVTSIDWPAVGRELRPRAGRAPTDSALRVVVGDMLRRLGESHFAILPPPADSSHEPGGVPGQALGTAGLVVRIVDRQFVVWRVDRAGPAHRAGIAPGWVIERIDDAAVPVVLPADTVASRRLARVMGVMHGLRGVPGSRVRIVGRDASGVRSEVSFVRDTVRGPVARFGNLPPLPASVELDRRTLADGRCVAVIRYEYWMVPVMAALDKAMESARGCAGVVMDLRGNLGGVAGMMMGVAGHFLSEPRTLGIMRTRGDEMRFAANPRRATDAGVAVEPFGGPLAIVVDGLSASTSEMFAAGLQALGRARVFGERTAGQALPAMATKLPSGDVLMHVVADFVAADGSRIEGRGVVPDEMIPLRRADLVAGRDAALDAAVRWIERTRPGSN
jgi:carboxyl-terminal processing protease